MTRLVMMRLAGFIRSGRVLAPLIAALVVIAVIYGGGPAPAASSYGYSAVMLFPVLAWQAKLLLDAEPDVQRRLARLAVGARREAGAGVLAAAAVATVTCAAAMISPWLFGGIRGPRPGTGEPPLPAGIALGALAHVLAVLTAVALGALASRAVTRSVLNGVAVLVTGSVLTIVFGLERSIAPWLAPPVMGIARALSGPLLPAATFGLLAAHAVAWTAAATAAYAWLRRRHA